jgi:transposase-like protein
MKTPQKREAGSVLEPHFQDEDKAREYLETMRWPDGTVCPHCGVVGEAYRIVRKEKTKEQVLEMLRARKRIRKTQKGIWKCKGCGKQFTVTVKTIFEDSHIPLHKWLLAIHLLCASKKGMSAHQLMRMLDIKQYKSAWFMAHRIRYAMTGELPEKMNGIVEADETYVGGKPRKSIRHAVKLGERAQDRIGHQVRKATVFSVVQRGGKVHSRHIERVTTENLKAVINAVCEADAHLITDTGALRGIGKERKHSLVNHSADEYVPIR